MQDGSYKDLMTFITKVLKLSSVLLKEIKIAIRTFYKHNFYSSYDSEVMDECVTSRSNISPNTVRGRKKSRGTTINCPIGWIHYIRKQLTYLIKKFPTINTLIRWCMVL
jgi:hypothetical protein